VNDVWYIVIDREPFKEGLRRLRTLIPPKENVEHAPVLVCRARQPMPDASDGCAHLVEMPPGTPPGFPVAEVFREEGSAPNARLAKGFMIHLNAALME